MHPLTYITNQRVHIQCPCVQKTTPATRHGSHVPPRGMGNRSQGFVVVIFPEVRRPARDERGILPAPSNRPSIKSPGLMGAPDNWGYLYAPHGRRGTSTLVVSVDHTVSSLNAAHRSQKSSFGLTADKIVGYKGNPSILRHRAWGNEGLDNPEVPYAVDECTRGHESNPLGPHAAQSTANQTFRRLPGGARPGRAF